LASLLSSLGMLAVFCASLHFRNPTLASICIGFYCFFSIAMSSQGNQTVKRRDCFLVVGGIAVFVVLVVLLGRRGFSAFEIFVTEPVFLVAVWLVVSAFTIWVWRVRRSEWRVVEKKT
jgi:hypothetical protein